jgi:N-dimethylarginine dimethylaminohydrolase
MAADLGQSAAYGGPGWSPRVASLEEELGSVWRVCGIDSEWAPLRSVLLHRPGPELGEADDPDAVQMLDRLDLGRAQAQHDAMAQAFRDAGVTVHYVAPDDPPPPNLIFVADLLFATPEGIILARPASTVRAGEERLVANRLAALGMPILRSVRGRGTFEGADAAWLGPDAALVATGLRTNTEGAAQVGDLLWEMGIEVVPVGLPYGAMHLMGTLRFVGPDLAIAWPGRVPYAAVEALRGRGFRVLFLPAFPGEEQRAALNFVTLGPRRILMPAGHPRSLAFLEEAGIECRTVVVDELLKAAGGIGCLTGVLERERL